MIETTAKVLKALGEPTRLKIIRVLAERELCICELVAVLDISQPRISQHVKVLREAGLVTERKERQNSYLTVNPAVLKGASVVSLIALMQTGLENISDLAGELERIQELDSNAEVLACKSDGRCDDKERQQTAI